MTHLSDRMAIAGFGLGCAACGLGIAYDAKAMLTIYLVVWFALSSVPVGAVAVLLTSYLVRGGWTSDLYPVLSRTALTLPAFALLFIPLIFGMAHVYPWASDGATVSAFKSIYLSPVFWTLRSIVYFVTMSGLAAWAAQAYGDQRAMRRVASTGLIVWPLIVSFAGVDWLESVEPDFHSSIYGLLAVAFDLLSGFCFAVAWMLLARWPHRMRNAAYSAVLLSLLLLWAYFHAMQYIVIWSGNIPDEVTWYLVRLDGAWSAALAVLFIGQFVLPFFLLLSERIRRSRTYLTGLAGLTLGMRLLEAAILVVPPQKLGNVAPWVFLPPALMVIACGAFFYWRAVEHFGIPSRRTPSLA